MIFFALAVVVVIVGIEIGNVKKRVRYLTEEVSELRNRIYTQTMDGK